MGGRRGKMLAAALAAFGELRTQAEMSLDSTVIPCNVPSPQDDSFKSIKMGCSCPVKALLAVAGEYSPRPTLSTTEIPQQIF